MYNTFSRAYLVAIPMQLHPWANKYRQLDKDLIELSEGKDSFFGIGNTFASQQLRIKKIAELKTLFGYKKDKQLSKEKCDRYKYMRAEARDPMHMAQLREELYSEEEKEREPVSPYPNHKGYTSLRLRYGKDPQYEDFFHNTQIEEGNIIHSNNVISFLQGGEHNGVDLFLGAHEDRYGERGEPGTRYYSSQAAEKIAKAQGWNVFHSGVNAQSVFLNEFPGKNQAEKITNFIELFQLKLAGHWDPSRERWIGVGISATVILSIGSENSLFGIYRSRNRVEGYWYPCPDIQPVMVWKPYKPEQKTSA